MKSSKKTPKSVEEVQKELQDFIREKFGGDVMAFPIHPGALGGGAAEELPRDDAAEEPELPADVLAFDMTPTQVKAYLDRFVIGQDEAKRTLAVAVCDHYNHVRRSLGAEKSRGAGEGGPRAMERPGVDYVKQNVILLGPTGVGKTYLIRILAQLVGVPFVKADVTKFSETGYVGGDVDDLVRELVRVADGNVQLAQHGIIFLDEIDKIASAQTQIGRDPSGRGVQVGLLKLMEETEVSLRNPFDIGAQFQDLMQMRSGGPKKRTINTRHILFVVSGAFSGLGEIIEKRLRERNVGFAAATAQAAEGEDATILSKAVTRDFVDFGFEPEFIGRLPVRVALDELTEDDLYRILTTSEGSILHQYRQNFSDYGLEVAFEDAALRSVARKAAEEQTGARGLMSVLERCLRNFKFHLPGTRVRRFAVTTVLVENPRAVLDAIQRSAELAASEYYTAAVGEFQSEFARRHGVKLELDGAAVQMAATLAAELEVPVKDYLWKVFSEHAEFLRAVAQKSGRFELPVTPEVLARPGAGAGIWMSASGAG